MRTLLIALSLVSLLLGNVHAQTLDEDPSANAGSQQSLPDGYDVILLAGQSNMSGRAPLSSSDPDAAVDARVLMWHPISGIVPAADPLVHQEPRKTGTAGLGLTLAKEYLRTVPANRKVLLVGAAYGGSSFAQDVTASTERWNFSLKKFEWVTNLHHRWLPTHDTSVGGDLYRGAVRRANDAMLAAGPTARFVGIVWHQGESDAVHGGADSYAANLRALIDALRSHITGASSRTPVVVGELNPCFLAACPQRTGAQPSDSTFRKILSAFHMLRDTVPYTAWVSSAGLQWLSDGTHFDLPSQRELGRRYAQKLFEATYNLPQAEVDFKMHAGRFFNVGTSINLSALSARISGNVVAGGSVAIVDADKRGPAAAIARAAGWLTTPVDGTLFNQSYTKTAWLRLDSMAYTNNLVSALNPVQRHHFMAPGGRLSAGHGGAVTTTYVQSTQALPSGTWVHVAMVYDALTRTMGLYIDGMPAGAATGVPPAPPAGGTVDLPFGRYGSGGSSYGIDGAMAGNKVYRRALSASQLRALKRTSW